MELDELLELQRQKQEQDAKNSKLASIADTYANMPSFGEFYSGKFRPQSNRATDYAKSVAAQESPVQNFEQRAKLEDYLSRRAKERALRDPSSVQSQVAFETLSGISPELAKRLQGKSAEDIESVFQNPLLREKMKAQIDAQNDIARINREKQLARDNSLAEIKARAEEERITNAAKPKTFSDSQYSAAGFGKRAKASEASLEKLLKDYDPNSMGESVLNSLSSVKVLPDWVPIVGGEMQNPRLRTDKRSEYDAIKRNFISAVLRKESGAAISNQEYENEAQKYFPQPGDSEEAKKFKAQARADAIASLEAAAGGAMGNINAVAQANSQGQAPMGPPPAPPTDLQMAARAELERRKAMKAQQGPTMVPTNASYQK